MRLVDNFFRYLLWLLLITPFALVAHDGQDERIKYWKNYYHPKLEVVRQEIPSVKISLKKIGPFFQLQTQVKNFKITPDQDQKIITPGPVMRNYLSMVFILQEYMVNTSSSKICQLVIMRSR